MKTLGFAKSELESSLFSFAALAAIDTRYRREAGGRGREGRAAREREEMGGEIRNDADIKLCYPRRS